MSHWKPRHIRSPIMNAEPNDSPVPVGKLSRRVWVIVCLIGLMIAGVVASFVSYQPRIECTLSDGRVAFCDGVVKGKKVSDSDFERDMYAYRESWFRPRPEGAERFLGLLKIFGRFREPDRYRYSEAPVLVLGGGQSGPPTEYQVVILHDGLGNEFDESWPSYGSDQPEPVNDKQLPMASKQWIFEFRNNDEQSIGQITVSNPSFHKKPGFEGKPAPLESRSAKGVLKLVSANFSIAKGGDPYRRNCANFEFDASGSPDLLPCQIVGVRVTDSWGNTSLIQGSVSGNGKTIHASWSGIERGVMQSPDWHVRIAVCRGRGAVFPTKDVVTFERLITSGQGMSSSKRFSHGRELKLLHPTCMSGNVPDVWKECWLMWELDDRGPFLWPIVIKVVGHLADGGLREINPADCKDPARAEWAAYWSAYWINRERSNPGSGKTPSFKVSAGLAIPPDVVEYDLHVALEDPTVFEFKVKVAGWPSPKAGGR